MTLGVLCEWKICFLVFGRGRGCGGCLWGLMVNLLLSLLAVL